MHKKLLQRCRIDQHPVICYQGRQALEHIRAVYHEQETFLVLLDLHMPVMDGWQFIEACKDENLDKVSIVIVTSYGLKAYEERAKKYNHVVGLFHKPLSIDDLEKVKSIYKEA